MNFIPKRMADVYLMLLTLTYINGDDGDKQELSLLMVQDGRIMAN